MQIQVVFFLLCGVLSVKGSPVDTSVAEAIVGVKVSESVKVDEPVESTESLKSLPLAESLESADNSLSLSDSEEALDISNAPKGRPVAQASLFVQTTSIFQSPPFAEISSKMGPVELSLRNVVAASAAATEEIYLEMSAKNAETSHMINSKYEILTAHAMNGLFEPLNKVEEEIKRTEECGKRYETALNMIFKEIDSSLKECSKNLTAVDDRYKKDNVGTLTSLSIAAQEMNNLPGSCEISQNFAVGTFCVVNNLAEMNERVLSNVKLIKQNTIFAQEETQKAVETTEMCQEKLVVRMNEKLNKLYKEIDDKCVNRKP